MKTHQQILQGEMRTLISKSCASTEENSSEFYSFHKALLKFFFDVVDVTINYAEKRITLLTSEPMRPSKQSLYRPISTVAVTMEYTHLEQTLLECLELGEKQTRFYRSLLFHYNHVSDGLGAWSA